MEPAVCLPSRLLPMALQLGDVYQCLNVFHTLTMILSHSVALSVCPNACFECVS